VKLFVDASAILAMLHHEPDAMDLADRLGDADDLFWSPMVIWEATVVLARLRGIDVARASGDVREFGKAWSINLVVIGERESELAVQAFGLYGKGTGHPAQLNMGDCFAYACAKANDARLLYKGDDFSATDLAR